MTQRLDLAAPTLCCGTGLHRNNALGLLAHKRKKLNTGQFLAKNNRSVGASPVKLKTRFARSMPIMVTSDMNALPLSDAF